MSLGICIIGLGRAGSFHLDSVTRIDGFDLAAAIDPNLESKPIDSRIPKLISLQEALEDPGIEAAIVAAPTQFHFEYISRFLGAGKHVFTEKPLGHSIDAIDTCYTLAEQNNLTLHLGFQRRCDQNFVSLKEKLSQLGPLRLIKASSRDNPRPTIEYLSTSKNIFHDMLIHDFDMALFLLGNQLPESVYAVGTVYDPEIRQLGDFDTVMVTIKYPGGLIYNVDTSRISAYGYDQRIEVFGERGMASVDNPGEDTVSLFTQDGAIKARAANSFSQRYNEAYRAELELFAQAIREGSGPNVSQEECLVAHLIADAAAESAKKEKIIDFREFYDDHLSGLR